ncbi:MAG: UDP-N-acetylglucosamine 2-epimerase (non-hydrolyzing) [Chitinophagaceae bacterium]|nr:UDP-N-acetylglucosamine 2-epimerase (non-hydrolyzing) [Chitinophagaceae bacterium]
MRKKKLMAIIGARPQFIKHAPLEIAAQKEFDFVTVHTGQHYDYRMSQIFFDELKMSRPAYNLNAGSGGHGAQTGKMMADLEPIMENEKPDGVLVYGDTNSTLAGALVASKLHIPVYHVEAGLRSYNREMPEEINRVLTDHVSSVLFVPTQQAIWNLEKEGITKNVYQIGDVMYDMIDICRKNNILQKDEEVFGKFYYATIHRPYNTDNDERLLRILEAFEQLPYPVDFAVHPRTLKRISTLSDTTKFNNIHFLEPVSYFDSIRKIHNSRAVITDSGGLQKEAYMLEKKCVTLRSETEWVETLQNNWNSLVFDKIEDILTEVESPVGDYIPALYGDGTAANEIIEILANLKTPVL